MKKTWIIFTVVVLLVACKSTFQATSNTQASIKVNADSLQLYDSSLHKMIAPYKAKLDSQMTIVIGVTNAKMNKAKPESLLGNLVCEAVMATAQKNYSKPIDACVFNYGGIRTSLIDSGTITVGMVYELMPFDNLVEVLEINGKQLYDLIQLTAAADGWPLAGIRYTLSNGKAENITIQHTPIDTTRTYVLATSDYIANGGDKAEMLKKPLVKFTLPIAVRDAIMEYIQLHSPLNTTTDGRIERKP